MVTDYINVLRKISTTRNINCIHEIWKIIEHGQDLTRCGKAGMHLNILYAHISSKYEHIVCLKITLGCQCVAETNTNKGIQKTVYIVNGNQYPLLLCNIDNRVSSMHISYYIFLGIEIDMSISYERMCCGMFQVIIWWKQEQMIKTHYVHIF